LSCCHSNWSSWEGKNEEKGAFGLEKKVDQP